MFIMIKYNITSRFLGGDNVDDNDNNNKNDT